MKIQELYDRDIERRINPAVVVSEMEEYFINQEIDEYVFTQGITKNVYRFLDAVANKKEGKTGVWISGYYGSGKSHFIKYLFYCLNNQFRERAFDNFKESVKEMDPLDEPTLGQAASLQKKLGGLDVAEIIFNIDAVSDNEDTKDRITRVLLNKLNEFRGYNNTNIALALYLEKPLDKQGNFPAFKDRIKADFNENWDRNQLRFTRRYLDKVIGIAQEFDADIDKESLKANILNRNQDYTIEFLIQELEDFLSTKEDNYRLLFFLDEVSQYIGSNTSLLLNLQTIVEEIGSKIGTQVWIVCTAQQDLSNLIDNTDSKTEDFGKILGRFETMVSLESQDAAFITKKRVLEKSANGIGELQEYYKANKGAIENQFVFDHDLYENFNGKEDFTLTYPFIPYQFRLISDVFESFSQVGYVGEGVKNTERAILGITHYTANRCKDEAVGFFVPFDLFFNEQLQKNLTHHARGMLDRAYSIEQVKNEDFAQRVVNALFMISNLGESQSVNFPANIENLALLLMKSADTTKRDMQRQVQQVLDVLVAKNIIQVSEGKYRFLKEDEIEVAHLIKNTPITNDDRLKLIYEDIITKLIQPKLVRTFGNNTFRIAVKVDDKEIVSRGHFSLTFSIYDNTDIENLAHATNSQDMVIGISEWLRHDHALKEQLSTYVRTEKYINNNTRSTGTRTETLKNFKNTNNLLLTEIKKRFENKFLDTAFISKQQVVKASEINGNSPITRFHEMVEWHMAELYRKHQLAINYATSNKDLIHHAKSKQKETSTALTPAEDEVNTKLIGMGTAPIVGDLIKQFEKAPYGWKDIGTLDVLLQLAKKGLKRFEWRNEEIDLETYVDKALNSRERDAISIHKEKVHSQEEINTFIATVNNHIFAETLIPSDTTDFKEAVKSFKDSLSPKLRKLNELKEDYEAYPFAIHLKNYHRTLSELYSNRNAEQVVEEVLSQQAALRTARDTYMQLEEFIEQNFKAYQQINQFVKQHGSNFSALDDTDQVNADELKDYLKTEQEPWDNFFKIKKIHKELSRAIKATLENLKKKLAIQYKAIFEEIDAQKVALEITEAHLTTDADSYLRSISKVGEIARLQIYELEANAFRANNFKRLEEFKAKQEAKETGKEVITAINVSLAAETKPTAIETPEQLDEYLSKLRERLMVKLAKGQKLWIS